MGANTLLIGITGKARSGKDTLAWMLVDTLRQRGLDARRYGWADALRAVCRVEYGMRGKDAALLQQVGVAYRQGCRSICDEVGHRHPETPNVWIDALLDQISEDAPAIALISDTRFPNEADAVCSRGGLLVRIERPNRPPSGRDDTHVSETALDGVEADYIVENVGDKVELQHYARKLAHIIEDRYDATTRPL